MSEDSKWNSSSTTNQESDSKLRSIRFEYSQHFPSILEHLKASILVTTYQAGKLLVLGSRDGKLTVSFLDYDQPMGLAVRHDRIAIGSRRQMHFLVAAHETLDPNPEKRLNDGCFVPRASTYTGNIHGHELAWGSDGLWVVNTLFSCLATLHSDFSFVPQWRPNFISQLIDQDRCHLNGLALENGKPRYVTAMAPSDTAAGWRPTKATSGIVMDVPSNSIISDGYAMPHSPRFHDDRLWVLNSGCGSLGLVDRKSGRYEAVETMPGYLRGLSFHGQFAFVGLSKIRETSVFGGVPIAEKRDELNCGVGVFDLVSGKTVAVFKFLTGVSEIFAVEVLGEFSNPMIAGASIDLQEKEVWIVPGESSMRPRISKVLPLFALKSHETEPATDVSTLPSQLRRVQQFRDSGQLDTAADELERIIVSLPVGSAEKKAALLVELGNLRQDQGQSNSARICYERAIESDTRCKAAWQNLGYVLFNRGETEKGGDTYDRLLQLDPSPINRLLDASVLPVIYDSLEEIDEWRDRQRLRLEKMVEDHVTVDVTKTLAPTSFLLAYQGQPNRELMELRGRILRGKDFVERRPSRISNRKPRIGFISAYFRDHTIGKLNLPRHRQLDRSAIEIVTIFTSTSSDSITQAFQQVSDEFVHLPRSLTQATNTLSRLNLDVLVYADVGMDSLTSTLVYSRFAPVQAVTWGHPDTTGSPMIDFFLSSSDLETQANGEHYSEKLIAMNSLGFIYDRPERRQPKKSRADWGFSSDRRLYVCPQTLFKFHPEFDEALHGILSADAEGILVLIEGRTPEWTHRLRRRWKRTLRVDSDRIKFLPTLSREDFLDLLEVADVVLDPFHFGGGNSSLESLVVGTPVVTMPGPLLRSRITHAIYKQMGIDSLSVADKQSYVQRALNVAHDSDLRSTYRHAINKSIEVMLSNKIAIDEWNRTLLDLARIARER